MSSRIAVSVLVVLVASCCSGGERSPATDPESSGMASGSSETNEAGEPVTIQNYLESPSALRSGSLRIADDWFTDMIPPGGGETRALLELESDGARVEFSAKPKAPIDGKPPERHHEETLTFTAGRDLLLELVGELEAAGWFGGEAIEVPEGGAYFEAHRYDVRVVLDGELGEVKLQQTLPEGASLEDDGRALSAAVEKVLERLANDG